MEQLTIDGKPVEKTISLRCFQVDDHDYYAAVDEDEARRLHCDLNELESSDVDSCTEVIGELLDKPWQEGGHRENGKNRTISPADSLQALRLCSRCPNGVYPNLMSGRAAPLRQNRVCFPIF
ncbi:hypothetical protein [Pseudomonas aeruginosa]|uniref:hypothetical protein n=1 Tax=Pseudomonas aeruginosa TaxID=287 RepID=UPI001910752A|nr:hypothetical protein [Pseudomonas aeruginosa]